MNNEINKYPKKLVKQGLADMDGTTIGILDERIIWSQKTNHTPLLKDIFNKLNCGALLLAAPAEPYKTIIDSLVKEALCKNVNHIAPEDCESRTFLHKIPIVNDTNPEVISTYLADYKGIIIPDIGILCAGSLTAEQCFVNCSSIFFALYVNFFWQIANNIMFNQKDEKKVALAKEIIADYSNFLKEIPPSLLSDKKLNINEEIIEAMIEAGEKTIEYRLVDSFFGNISFYKENPEMQSDTLFISQTGSAMDELRGYIDECPEDNSTCTALTASSEFSAHKEIYKNNLCRAILHGHPKFIVIMSMICDDKENCQGRDNCYRECSKERFLQDIPIVPGEVGTGKYGLCNTLPPAIKDRPGAIVYGHGLFTVDKDNYNNAFDNLVSIEKAAVKKYLSLLEN